MGDEEPEYKAEYLDGTEGESYNWAKRPGKVKVTYADGSTFEGILNDERMKHGKGVYTWKKPGEEGEEPVVHATYDGDFWNGKRQGMGKMTYPNGDIYQGQFQDGKHHGEGTYIYKKTSDIFSGTWVEGVKTGEGAYQFGADSSTFKGTWETGTFVKGQWVFTDGTEYAGTFERGRPVGPGSFALHNGITQTGEFVATKPPEGEEEEEPKVTWVGVPVVTV